MEEIDYDYRMDKVYVDVFGNVVGKAGCGSTAFVCSADEIPQFLAFFQELVAANARK